MRRSSRTVLSCLAVAVAGVLIAGGGWALAASRNARPVNAQIVANFAQFRRARTPADALPASIKPDARSCWGPGWPYGRAAAAGTFGLDSFYQLQCTSLSGRSPDRILKGRQIIAGLQRDQSRAVRLPGGLGKVWLIPSGRWLCNVWRFRPAPGPGISFAMACEPITEVLAHPPLWPGEIACYSSCGPSNGADLFALEPDRFTKVTLGYHGGTQPTYLANNVLGACIGLGSSWLEQTGPDGTVTTPLGGGKLNGQPKRYHPRECPHLR